MRRLILTIFITIIVPYTVTAGIRLQYLPSIPVQQTNKLTINARETLPFLNLNTKGNQVFKYDLVPKNRQHAPPGQLKLPLLLSLTVRDLYVHVNANGEEAVYDPRNGRTAPALMTFSNLIDKPISLFVNAHGQLEKDTTVFENLYHQYPSLQQLNLESLFNDVVSDLFALHDEDLSPGTKIEMQSPPGPVFSIPTSVTYDILDINDKEVVASLSGSIEPRKIALDKTIKGEGGKEYPVEMLLSGKMHGKAFWQRSNAMLYTLNSEYIYKADFRAGNTRWSMELNVSRSVDTAPLQTIPP